MVGLCFFLGKSFRWCVVFVGIVTLKSFEEFLIKSFCRFLCVLDASFVLRVRLLLFLVINTTSIYSIAHSSLKKITKKVASSLGKASFAIVEISPVRLDLCKSLAS